MGRDKARVVLDGRPLLERAVATLAAVCCDVRLACGAAPRYAELGLPLVLDRGADLGPLAGLEAGLAEARAAGRAWVVALACDMPGVDADVLRDLLAEARVRGLDACFLEGPRGVEPLCGAWRSDLVESVAAALDAGERRVIAFERYPTAGAPPRVGTLRLARELSVANLNTPDDVATALACRAKEPG
jgi:molybdopterin-guanine dinucleotide biosynthesis protein A